jgi:pimeloyl-ACP methyl ester carboxylesterase
MTYPSPHDPQIQFTSYNGRKLAYTVEGPQSPNEQNADAIILVHGIPGSVADFRYLGPLLAEKMRVYRLDFPGFGQSEIAPLRQSNLISRSDLIMGFADSLGLDRFMLLGHSMGGPPAMVTASRFPQRVSRLVMLASVGLRRHRGLFMNPKSIWPAIALSYLPGVQAMMVRNTRAAYKRMRFPGSDKLEAAEVRHHASIVAGISFRQLNAAAAKVNCPSLVSYAEDDKLVEPRVGEGLAHALNAETLVFPEGGHNIQKTKAENIAEAICGTPL